MTPERFQEVKKHLAAALERKREERSAYLDRACTDPSLRREVESLLATQEHGKDPKFSPSSFVAHSEDATLTTLGSETAQIGVFIGPYQLNQQLGEGGMGVVFRAT